MRKISTRLQKIILELLKYEFIVECLPSKDMYLAATLSRAFLKHVHDDPEMLHTIYSIAKYLPMSVSRIDEFQNALKDDDLN